MSSWTKVNQVCCEARTFTDCDRPAYTLILNGLEVEKEGFPVVYIPKPFSIKQIGYLFTITPNIGQAVTVDYRKVTTPGTLTEFRDQLAEWACTDCGSTSGGVLPGDIIIENWTGVETDITIPIPLVGREVDVNSIQLFADGALQAPGYSNPFDFGYTVVVNGDGSVTLTPSEVWGEPDRTSRMVVYYSTKAI